MKLNTQAVVKFFEEPRGKLWSTVRDDVSRKATESLDLVDVCSSYMCRSPDCFCW